MKMKKYTAPSISEAMKLVRAELGEDAVIINSKVIVTKKLFGLIKQKNFEVLAGVDQVETKTMSPQLPDLQSNTKTIQYKEPEEQPKLHIDDTLSKELKSEIADLKLMMKSMQKHTIQSELPENFLPYIDFLKRQELSEELITAISDELFVHQKQKNAPLTEVEMKEITKEVLRELLKELPMGGLSYQKKYINVFGPTGVGKTTTIAKMAARSVLEKKKKIGFITTDTYRIAAIEQLKTYANLLQAPVEIVYNANDYKKAIENFAHLDLVFIDTAGRNYKEAKYVDDLKKMINFDEEVESYLVLALTAKEQDMESIIQQFGEIPIGKYIFTKIDETNSIGTMYNLMIKYNKGLAYYTNGQEVPEDIEVADLDAVLELFFQGEYE
ncbi:flagellar biosynthesis protein FlhF [Ureibacillus sinduriensis]|uniref:Flagellar biosynthesis protein FlhF n=1 Tax=Ureibacillus sinduriensis BLB-1 = JCM 15800 TaxID=1384057 RepID=A0A0A3HRT2_9BACL|nr:flagellar biosynthesis protein FlhF [Ureibacillus sinduriensis]KGR73910.1 flagellar biosynthesis regulator FlhF [Ureibacillus sinduriensis BLB-1 = JCM 15800]